jgi:type IV pilus assembly protein PilO
LNERLEKIFESPASVKLGILFGSIVLLFGAFYFFSYADVSDSIDQLNAKLEGPKGLRAQIIEKEGIARNLDLYEKEVETLDVQLKLALRELPDKREIYLFLDSISDKARNAGLDVPLFQPQPELKRDFYAEVPVQISVRGTFHQVATFFDEVGHLERIVNIDRFQMGQPWQEKERIQLTTNLTATTFRFLDESERPKLEEKPTSKTKRRRGRAAKADS